MPRTIVNDVERAVETGCQTWGELLSGVDRDCALESRVVTAVRFDGVDDPAFREAAACARGLEEFATIEIEAVAPRQLLLDSLGQAVLASETLAAAADRVGAGFRQADVSAASRDLGELAQGMGTLVAITHALGQALAVDLGALECATGTAGEMIAEMGRFASDLLQAQAGGDWIGVADIIEYDIAPALRRWPSIFEAYRDAVPRAAGSAA